MKAQINTLANLIISETIENGGITISPQAEKPTTGYMVSIKDCFVFDSIDSIDQQIIIDWIIEHLEIKYPIFFGGWLDKETGKSYFDISICLKSLEQAENEAIKNNQLAIWHIDTKEEIRINVLA